MLRSILFFLTFISVVPLTAQTSYFINPAGNDANPGTLNQPWQTIQHAANTVAPGSVVQIMAGTYNEKVSINVSGTSQSRIVFQNYSGQQVILDGTNIAGNAMIEIVNQSYITIRGLVIRNNIQNDAQGILIEGNARSITIVSNLIHDIHFSNNPNDLATTGTNAQPLIVYGTDAATAISNLIVDSNEIRNCRTGYSEGLAVNGNVDGFNVRYNKVHDLTNIGIDIIGHEGTCPTTAYDQARNGKVRWNEVWNCVSAYATSAGIYVDGGLNVTIENNRVYRNGWGIEVGCEGIGKETNYITVRNNLIYDNVDSGISLGGYDYPGGSGKVTNAKINNNTLINNVTDQTGNGEINVYYNENSSILNNLVYSTTTHIMITNLIGSPGMTINYNLFYSPSTSEEFVWYGGTSIGLAAWQTQNFFDINSVNSNPQLANVNTYDIHIAATSPAVDAGSLNYLAANGETDWDTMTRVQNSRVDIGADEYGTAIGIEEHLENQLTVMVDLATNVVMVNFPEVLKENETLEVYNASGQLLTHVLVSSGSQRVSITTQGYAAGLYLIQLRGKQTKQGSFILTR
jgi:hypothetical protein